MFIIVKQIQSPWWIIPKQNMHNMKMHLIFYYILAAC